MRILICGLDFSFDNFKYHVQMARMDFLSGFTASHQRGALLERSVRVMCAPNGRFREDES